MLLSCFKRRNDYNNGVEDEYRGDSVEDCLDDGEDDFVSGSDGDDISDNSDVNDGVGDIDDNDDYGSNAGCDDYIGNDVNDDANDGDDDDEPLTSRAGHDPIRTSNINRVKHICPTDPSLLCVQMVDRKPDLAVFPRILVWYSKSRRRLAISSRHSFDFRLPARDLSSEKISGLRPHLFSEIQPETGDQRFIPNSCPVSRFQPEIAVLSRFGL
jgi:hypothetical protein